MTTNNEKLKLALEEVRVLIVSAMATERLLEELVKAEPDAE